MQILTNPRSAPLTRSHASSVSAEARSAVGEALETPIVDGFLSSPEAQASAPGYSEVMLETGKGVVGSAAALAGMGAIAGWMTAGTASLLTLAGGALLKDVRLMAYGAAGLAATTGVGMVAGAVGDAVEKRAKAKPAPQPPAAPAPSQMPGGETSIDEVLNQAWKQDQDLHARLRGGMYVNDTPAGELWTHGYPGATLGHMHSWSSKSIKEEELRVQSARVQRKVNLTIGTATAAAAVVAAAAGHGWVGLGLGGWSATWLSAAKSCRESEQKSLALADIHRVNQADIEQLGRSL